jgi:hypothetical protein
MTFISKLGEPRDRFLAAVVEHALSVGRRKPTDFIRSFGPRDIMRALGDQAALRAKILVAATGVNEKIASRKPADSAGEDLEIALNEGVTTEDAIVSLFDPDDRVRYLDHGRLWAFVTEGEFWKKPDAASLEIVRKHVTYILERARAEKLVTARDIVDGIGLDTLVVSLPKDDVVKILETALSDGRMGKGFKDERVLELAPPAHLVEHVEINHIWDRVIARKLGFAAVTRPPVGFESVPAPVSEEAIPLISSPSSISSPSISSPSLELTVEEGDPLVDEEETNGTSIDVEAMLARVGPSEAPDTHASTRPDEEMRSGLTSRPPR